MKTSLTYGIGLTIATGILMMILHVAGFMTDSSKFMTGVIIMIPSAIILTIIGLILGMRTRRNEVPKEEGFSYGQAFKTGMLIIAFSALFGTAFNILYFKVINPDYTNTAIGWTRAFMEGHGIDEDKIEQTEAKMRADNTVVKQATKGIINSLIFGTVFSLICAAFIKRAPVEPFQKV